MFEAEQMAEPILLCGVELPASEATMFEDLQVLSRAYAKEKPQIRYQKKPVYTMVATSSRGLFMGDVVEKKNPGRKHLQIRKGQWVVKVAIPYRMQAALPAKVARLRKQFYQDWLPDQPYTSASWQDLEVYHYRQRYFRKSVKMVMELWFCLEPKVKE